MFSSYCMRIKNEIKSVFNNFVDNIGFEAFYNSWGRPGPVRTKGPLCLVGGWNKTKRF